MTSAKAHKAHKAHKTRRTAALALAAVGVAGLSVASAAQLNLGSSSLGAGTTVVASCQAGTPIDVAFESSFADAEYKATSLNLSSIEAACEGLDYKVTLTDSAGAVLGSEATGTVSGDSISVPLTGVSAKDVANVAVVIHS